MRSSSRLRSLIPGLAPRHRSSQAGRNRGARPQVETLEGKVLMAAGALDSTFGTGGLVATDLLGATSKTGRAVAVWDSGTASAPGDDKIVVAGSSSTGAGGPGAFVLARYNADGSLDTGFGTGGVVSTPLDSVGGGAVDVAFQSDGRVVVAGNRFAETGANYAGDFVLALYTAAGQLDPTFGANGTVITDIGGLDNVAYDIAIDEADRIVLVGTTPTAKGQDFAMARYTRDGRLDGGFGGGSGIVITDFGAVDNVAFGVAVAADGRIVVAGTTGNYGSGTYYLVARYDSVGLLDTSFDGDGSLVTAFNTSNAYSDFGGSPTAFALDRGGRIVLAGYSDAAFAGSGGTVLARYYADGSQDNAFGTGGTPTIPGVIRDLEIDPLGRVVASTGGLVRFTSGGVPDNDFNGSGTADVTFAANALALDPSGRIVVTGGAGNDCALARYADDGSRDAGFGLDGPLIAPFPDRSAASYGRDVALQPDGMAIVAGINRDMSGSRIVLTRYAVGGALDTTFGVNGTVDTGLPGSDWEGEPASVALWDNGTPTIWSDDKILVAGGRFGVARFTMTGTLETSFGNQGRVLLNLRGDAYDVAVDSAGRVVLAGEKFVPISGSLGGYYDTMIVRLLPNGTPDGSFGSGGTVVTSHSRYSDAARSVAIVGLAGQPGYRIVVAGYVAGSKNNDFLLARYAENGMPDSGFGSGGRVVTDFGGNEVGCGVALQSDGKIVLAGLSGGDFALARYTSAGVLDKTFDVDGKVTTDFGGTDYAFAVAIQGDGKIVAAGTSNGRFALARYNTNGGLDTAFGSGGKVITDIQGGNEEVRAVAICPPSDPVNGGKIVAVGYSTGPGTGPDLALARYQPENGTTSGTPTVAIANASVVEGNTGLVALNFTVTLSRASTESININFATVAGTATEGVDYQAAAGSVRFDPGQTTKTITIWVIGDTLVEVDETFSLVLLDAPTGREIGRATGTILNEDASTGSKGGKK